MVNESASFMISSVMIVNKIDGNIQLDLRVFETLFCIEDVVYKPYTLVAVELVKTVLPTIF